MELGFGPEFSVLGEVVSVMPAETEYGRVAVVLEGASAELEHPVDRTAREPAIPIAA
jgi:hypothetical protein